MANPEISIIAAVSKNRGIGKNNEIPWHIPADLKRFQRLTVGHPVIMGRKTYESIGKKPLPNRVNIVISRNLESIQGCLVCSSPEKALEIARAFDEERIFIMGGGEVYEQMIGVAERLYLTVVDGEFEADTFFPDYSEFTKVVSEEPGQHEGYIYRFIELERG